MFNRRTPENIINASANEPWSVQINPFRVAPHIFYVGNLWVGCFLIETDDGLILIDTSTFETIYLLLESIRGLGFNPGDIKKILLSHAHVDHDGGARCLKELTGADVYLSREDDVWRKNPASVLETDKFKIMDYEVDYYYDETNPIIMGDVVIRTRLTAGHTPGCTSFFVDVKDENGEKLTWAMHGGVGINTLNSSYLNKVKLPLSLQTVFLEDCEKMKEIHVDICTPSHPSHSDMLSLVPDGGIDYHPFLDSKKWPEFLEARSKVLREVLEEEKRG